MGQPHTPTQRKMVAVLADGKPHPRAELHACLSDELAPQSAVNFHLSAIRAKLRPDGLDILCVLRNRKLHYQLVRPVTAPGDPPPAGAVAVRGPRGEG